MDKSDWVWMPHPAHFIAGTSCRFHLATNVGGYIVSTVGEYWPDRDTRRIIAKCKGISIKGSGDQWDADYQKKIGFEQIGFNRTYETIVFKSQRSTESDPNYLCCAFEICDAGNELEMRGYNSATEANKGHLELCNKWSRQ